MRGLDPRIPLRKAPHCPPKRDGRDNKPGHDKLLAIQPPSRKAEQALRQEDDHGDENDTERNQIRKLIAEHARQEFAQQQEEAGANYSVGRHITGTRR